MPNPHKMICHQPAVRWQDALPTGNGTIGAMAHGSNPQRDDLVES